MLPLYVLATIAFTSYLSVVAYYIHDLCKNNHEASPSSTYVWDQSVAGCYYINLDHETNKRNHTELMLTIIAINAQRYSAIDPQNVSKNYQTLTEDTLGKKEITYTQIAAKLSHLDLLRTADRIGWTIIFEDTIVPSKKCNAENIIRLLDGLPDEALVQFGMSPWRVLWYVLTFAFTKTKQGVW